jgi:hypothetical protein
MPEGATYRSSRVFTQTSASPTLPPGSASTS